MLAEYRRSTVRVPAYKRNPSHIEIGQHGRVEGIRRQAETGYASSRPFVAPQVTRVSNKERKGTGLQHYRRSEDMPYASRIPKQTRAGEALPCAARATRMLEARHLN